MFTFSIYVFGKWSTYVNPLSAEELADKVAWAIDNEFPYQVKPV